MISIEPLLFFVGQQVSNQAAGIDRAQRQGFELEEVAEFAAAGLAVHRQVLDAHAPATRAISAGFDRGNHPRLHRRLRCRCRLISDHLRTFVNVEEIAHAMTGAVTVVDVVSPDRRTSDGVEQRRQNAFRESCPRQRNHTLQHARAILFLLLSRRTHRDHACDVCGTAEVLATGVDEQQTITLDYRMLLFSSVIVRHRAIGVERGNGVEAQRNIIGATFTGSGKFLVDGQFGDALAPPRRFQPGKEFAQRRAILLHRFTDVLRVGFAFLRLGQRSRVEAFDQFHATVQIIQQPHGHSRRIDQQARAARHSTQRIGHFAVVTQRHAILLQYRAQIGIDLAQRHKQRGLLLIDQGERNKHRIERDITTTQVEQPGDVIQGGDEVPVGTTFLQGFAQFREFLATADGRLRRQMLIDRRVRQARAITPDFLQQVDIGAQASTACLELAAQCARRSHRHYRTINGNHAALGGLLRQPVQRARLPRLQLDQFDAAAVELFRRLFPVTTVGPHTGEIRSDDQRTDRTVETRQPLPALPVTRQVFRKMRVGGRHQQRMDAFAAHQFTGMRQALRHRSFGQGVGTHHVSC